jgi:uncharacterized protein (DUF1800 family)
MGFGIDSAMLTQYSQLGREGFLDAQLAARDEQLPPDIARLVGSYEAESAPLGPLAMQMRDEQKRIKDMPAGPDQVEAKKAQQKHGNELARQAQQAELLRAIYSPAQLKEQMVWFWLNHFSIYHAKGRVRWLAADYADRAIRPHAMGRFRDLVMASLTSPAMLEYLDNAQNAKDHVNENYARELMELHTLGVDAGYTQQDVQQLALILTGVGVNFNDEPRKLKPQWRALYRREGLFEFNPARHDFSDKVLLGHPIKGSGLDEVEQAVTLITRQPACARFISHELAVYFVADDPPPALVERMASTFSRTDGDIAAVLRTMLLSPEMQNHAGKKFKDPTQFMVSAMRLSYDGQPIANAGPLVNWINAMAQAPFGRLTPDGWPLASSAWSSSGQLTRRFEIARAIGSGNRNLFVADGDDKSDVRSPPPSIRTSAMYVDLIEPGLSASTRAALEKAASPKEWNTFLLSSPEFNAR